MCLFDWWFDWLFVSSFVRSFVYLFARLLLEAKAGLSVHLRDGLA